MAAHMVRFLEDLRNVIMLSDQMVRFLDKFGKAHLGGEGVTWCI